MRVCGLFCGIGGINLAFIKAGHEIVWANDIDKYACILSHLFKRLDDAKKKQ